MNKKNYIINIRGTCSETPTSFTYFTRGQLWLLRKAEKNFLSSLQLEGNCKWVKRQSQS